MTEKSIDGETKAWYSKRAMEVGLFFMPKNKLSGGGSCAHKNHIGMYRM